MPQHYPTDQSLELDDMLFQAIAPVGDCPRCGTQTQVHSKLTEDEEFLLYCPECGWRRRIH